MIEDLKNGNEEGLKAAYYLYKRSLLYFSLQFVYRETAEEIVADIFIKTEELRDQFDSKERLKSFLCISTKNACLNHLRKPYSKQIYETWEAQVDALSEDPEIYTAIIRAELLEQIYNEVATLPSKQSEVFRMTYVEDLTVEEISEKLRISPTAVYINRSRALAYLRSSIKIRNSFYLLVFIQFFFLFVSAH